jgi:hypothetical protein
MFGLGVNRLGASRSLLGDAISNLFSNGEQGCWYDPSDISTMFQEDTSAVPAIIGQPVGTILDKSQGLNRGSELITNGSFDTDSNWTKAEGWSIAGGVAVANNISGKNLSQTGLGLVTNAVYEVTFTIVTRSSGTVIVRLGGSTPVSSLSYNAVGTYKVILRANASNNTIAVRGQGGFTGTIDNVSLKQIEGNHARQITSDKRPILARHPEGGIRNLFDYTQEFDDWDKGTNITLTEDYATSPDNTQTADRLQMGAQSLTYIRQLVSITAGETYTFSVYVKATSGTSNFDMFSAGNFQLGQQTATSEWQRFN